MSKEKNRHMHLALFGLMAIIVITMAIGYPAAPAEAETLKAKVTNYSVKLEYVPAGDVQGHVIGLDVREGNAVFDDGQTAKYAMVSTFDFMAGKGGTTNGYTKMTFKDDTFITFKWAANAGIDPDKLSTSKGTGTILGGGGRYKGIKGSVSFAGKGTKPASEDPKREMVIDAVIDYTLP
ncbi:MAG: hypothetical protein AB1473_04765 [Thermodesulfobacteriota bacterium]